MRSVLGWVVFVAIPAAPLGAQAPVAPTGPLTLVEAITLGRQHGVDAAIARLNVRAAEAHTGQRRAEWLPNSGGGPSVTRQTLNLEEFGIPGAGGAPPAFSTNSLQLRGTQPLLALSAIARLRAG